MNMLYWLLDINPMWVVLGFLSGSSLGVYAMIPKGWGDRFTPTLAFVLVLTITSLATSQYYLSVCGQNCFLVEIESGKILAFQKESMVFWSFHPRYRGQNLEEPAGKGSAARVFHPVTENPKVRDIKYHVAIKIDESKATSGNWFRLAQDENSLNRWVEYQLFEFNEKYSKQTALLYNPLDDNQQLEFTRLVAEFIGPKLKEIDGQLESARFTIETGEPQTVYIRR